MEIRVWDEEGLLVGFCTIKPKGDDYEISTYPNGVHDLNHIVESEETAIGAARVICEQWKERAEMEYRQQHGVNPVGVESETGFTIQEVE